LAAGPVPNPWSFTTICINPYIVTTNPADRAFDVPVTQPIVVTFNEPMNTATVTYTMTGGIALTQSWNANRDVLTLNHAAPFAVMATYPAPIPLAYATPFRLLPPGPVPNPWSFQTVGINPFVNTTDPANGANGVPLTAPIVVTFSEAMNTGTVTYTLSGGIAV